MRIAYCGSWPPAHGRLAVRQTIYNGSVGNLHILSHPLAGELLAHLRDLDTPPERFRDLTLTLTTLLVIEATRDIETRASKVFTPLEEADVRVLQQGLAAVPILRAGLGMLEPVVQLFRDVKVGYIGLERDHATAVAHSYYCKLPEMSGRYVLCLDPMLATGGSASQAISLIKAHRGTTVKMVSIVAAPEGVARVQRDHPDIDIFVGAYDRGLNAKKYIVPGLGDYGDRLYGTF